MGSFRNQLLVLIIGLIVVTQSVTLIAVLARVENSVAARAGEQLAAGGNFIDQLLRFRAAQLASGVGVLAADFGFREAVASGDKATMLSAADNHMRRIGAGLMLLLDTTGGCSPRPRHWIRGPKSSCITSSTPATWRATTRTCLRSAGGRTSSS